MTDDIEEEEKFFLQKFKRKDLKNSRREKSQKIEMNCCKTVVTETKYYNIDNNNQKYLGKHKEQYKKQKESQMKNKKRNNGSCQSKNDKSLIKPGEQNMIFEKALENIQTSLKMPPQELKHTLTAILFSSDADSKLYDFLGPCFIPEIEILLKNKKNILKPNQKIQNFYTEIILPPTPISNYEIRERNNFKFFPYSYFNPVQSRVLKISQSDNNFLLAAPTGSGKTDVACLCIYRNSFREHSDILNQETISRISHSGDLANQKLSQNSRGKNTKKQQILEHSDHSENLKQKTDSTLLSREEFKTSSIDIKSNTVYVVPLRALATEITKKLRDKFSCVNCGQRRREIDHFITHGKISALPSQKSISKHQHKNNQILQDSTFGEIPHHVHENLLSKYSCRHKSKYDLPCLDVMEYTGDTPFQPLMARIIVTTPEKLDGCSRKLSFSYNFSLMIIDEIHLLEEERGSVIETLVARFRDKTVIKRTPSISISNDNPEHAMIKNFEPTNILVSNKNRIRIVGLSATVTNTSDVAQFLDGPVFHFDDSFRQVPMRMHLIGAKESIECSQSQLDDRRNSYEWAKIEDQGGQQTLNPNSKDETADGEKFDRNMVSRNKFDPKIVKREYDSPKNTEYGFKKSSKRRFGPVQDRNKPIKINNFEEILIEKLLSLSGQTLIFVNSRYECYKTASLIIRRIILRHDKQRMQNKSKQYDLDHFLRFGIGIHNAGMPRASRQKVEALFLNFKLKYVICTKTLAWGLNMPAKNVILFKTKYYSDGKFRDVSLSDVLQIVGRAGRIDYMKNTGVSMDKDLEIFHQRPSECSEKRPSSQEILHHRKNLSVKSLESLKRDSQPHHDSQFSINQNIPNHMNNIQDGNMGNALIITDNLNFYITKLKTKPPIESTLLTNMINCLNSQIGLEPFMNSNECLKWFRRTFLYVRGLKSPGAYGFNLNDDSLSSNIENSNFTERKYEHPLQKDKQLNGRENDFGMDHTHEISNISHHRFPSEEYQDEKFQLYEHVIRNLLELAITKLRSCNLITKTDPFQSTWEGRVASYYYIDFRTIGKIVDFLRIENLQEQMQGLLIKQNESFCGSSTLDTFQTDKETRTNHQSLFNNHFEKLIFLKFEPLEILIIELLLDTKEFTSISVRHEESESIIQEVEFFVSHSKVNLTKTRPLTNENSLLKVFLNVSEISVSSGQKLLFLLHQFVMGFQPTIFSLIADTHFLRKNLTRLLAAFEQTCLLKDKFDMFRTAFFLRRRIEGKHHGAMLKEKNSSENKKNHGYIKLETNLINNKPYTHLDVQMNRDESFFIFISLIPNEKKQLEKESVDFAAVFHNKSTFYFTDNIKQAEIEIYSDSSSFLYNSKNKAIFRGESHNLKDITNLIPYNLSYKRERLALIEMDLKRLLDNSKDDKILIVYEEILQLDKEMLREKDIYYITVDELLNHFNPKRGKKYKFEDLKRKSFNHIFIAGCFSLDTFTLINKIKTDEITILDRNDICQFLDSIID